MKNLNSKTVIHMAVFLPPLGYCFNIRMEVVMVVAYSGLGRQMQSMVGGTVKSMDCSYCK